MEVANLANLDSIDTPIFTLIPYPFQMLYHVFGVFVHDWKVALQRFVSEGSRQNLSMWTPHAHLRCNQSIIQSTDKNFVVD